MKEITKDWLSSAESDLQIIQYISGRYPGEMGLLPDGKPSLTEANNFKVFAQSIYNLTFTLCK